MINLIKVMSLALTIVAASSGQAFAGYAVGRAYSGSYFCYNSDAYNQPFGDPVQDMLCHNRYKVGMGSDGYKHCFHADVYGQVYGQFVPDYFCNGGN